MKKVRAAYQGYPGAYSDEACRQIFNEGDYVEPVGFRTFEEAFMSVREGTCDVAVLPFENSLGTDWHLISISIRCTYSLHVNFVSLD